MNKNKFCLFFIFLLGDFFAIAQPVEFKFYNDMELTKQFACISFDSNGIIKKVQFKNDLLLCSQFIENEKIRIDVIKNDEQQKKTFYFQESGDFLIIQNKNLNKRISFEKNTHNLKTVYIADDYYFSFGKDLFVYKKDSKENTFENNNFSYSAVKTIKKSYYSLIQVESIDKNSISYGYYSLNDDGRGGVFYKDFDFYSLINNKNTFSMSTNVLNYLILMEYIPREYISIILGFNNLQFRYNKTDIINYEVSSFLTEGNSIYAAENLASIDGLPWASANGYGINDTITLTLHTGTAPKLLIYNGFQSTEKPDLYNKNSRVKKITIKNIDIKKEKDFLLEDNTNPQFLDISDICKPYFGVQRLQLIILDIYPGTKYKDLCIQAIVPET
ncbi:hypothetical protein H0R92_09995 [Treponema sp. OMZ 840]|uniref:NADase-type glycan-binding domain-containing protein n=1 Tax=Treponema sp. OMZ 840 TaxID=244313 RepID=UPI003D915687